MITRYLSTGDTLEIPADDCGPLSPELCIPFIRRILAIAQQDGFDLSAQIYPQEHFYYQDRIWGCADEDDLNIPDDWTIGRIIRKPTSDDTSLDSSLAVTALTDEISRLTRQADETAALLGRVEITSGFLVQEKPHIAIDQWTSFFYDLHSDGVVTVSGEIKNDTKHLTPQLTERVKNHQEKLWHQLGLVSVLGIPGPDTHYEITDEPVGQPSVEKLSRYVEQQLAR